MRTHSIHMLLLFACSAALAALAFAAQPSHGYPSAGAQTTSIRENSWDSTDSTIPLEVFLAKAREAVRRKTWDLAEAYYQNVLIRNPRNMEGILELAGVYEEMGKLEYARGLLIRASTLDPYNKAIIKRSLEIEQKLSRYLHQEIDTLVATGNFETAIPKLSLLLTLEPENPALYFTKALCQYKVGNPEAALPAVEKAMRLQNDSSYPALHQTILESLKQKKVHVLMQQATDYINPETEQDKNKALILLAEIIELDPDNGWAKSEFLRLSEGETEDWEDVSTTTNEARPVTPFKRITDYAGAGASLLFRAAVAVSRHLEFLLSLLLVLLIFNSQLTYSLIKGFAPRVPLSGSLSQFSITEILILINSHGHTGTLYIRGKSIKGEIFFEKGEAYHCQTKHLKGKEALRSILEAPKHGYFYFRETRPAIERTIDMPLSLIIMNLPERKSSGESQSTPKITRSKIADLLESRSKGT